MKKLAVYLEKRDNPRLKNQDFLITEDDVDFQDLVEFFKRYEKFGWIVHHVETMEEGLDIIKLGMEY